jgi:hypothetical protein
MRLLLLVLVVHQDLLALLRQFLEMRLQTIPVFLVVASADMATEPTHVRAARRLIGFGNGIRVSPGVAEQRRDGQNDFDPHGNVFL